MSLCNEAHGALGGLEDIDVVNDIGVNHPQADGPPHRVRGGAVDLRRVLAAERAAAVTGPLDADRNGWIDENDAVLQTTIRVDEGQ